LLRFEAGNNISFNFSTNASHYATLRIAAVAPTAGLSDIHLAWGQGGTVLGSQVIPSIRTLDLVAESNVTLSGEAWPNYGGAVHISAAGGGMSELYLHPTGGSTLGVASMTGLNIMEFVAGSNVTLSLDNHGGGFGELRIDAGGGGLRAGIAEKEGFVGTTTGASGTFNVNQLVLTAGQNMVLSAVTQTGGFMGIEIGQAGDSRQFVPAEPLLWAHTTLRDLSQTGVVMWPFHVEATAAEAANMFISMFAPASAATGSLTVSVGIYAFLGGGTLMRLTSGSRSHSYNMAGGASILKAMHIPNFLVSFSAVDYVMAFAASRAGAISVSIPAYELFDGNFQGDLGVNSAASNQALPGWGWFSSHTMPMMPSVSQLVGSAASLLRAPMIYLSRSFPPIS
jgi:hypothetical protein